MPHLSHIDFAAVDQALQGLLAANTPETREQAREAVKLLSAAKARVASPELRALAVDLHATDEIEIDDEGVGTSASDEGTWVQAWVWVSREEMVDASIACLTDGCTNDPNTGEGFDGYCGSCADKQETECAET